MEQYFGYDLGTAAPDVRRELVQFLLENNADIRALHYAIVTSIPYLQSSQGGFDDDGVDRGPLNRPSPRSGWTLSRSSSATSSAPVITACPARRHLDSIVTPGAWRWSAATLDAQRGEPPGHQLLKHRRDPRWLPDEEAVGPSR